MQLVAAQILRVRRLRRVSEEVGVAQRRLSWPVRPAGTSKWNKIGCATNASLADLHAEQVDNSRANRSKAIPRVKIPCKKRSLLIFEQGFPLAAEVSIVLLLRGGGTAMAQTLASPRLNAISERASRRMRASTSLPALLVSKAGLV